MTPKSKKWSKNPAIIRFKEKSLLKSMKLARKFGRIRQ